MHAPLNPNADRDRDQATEANDYARLFSLKDMEVYRFTFMMGTFGVSYDLTTRSVSCQGPLPDMTPDDTVPSFFQIVAKCGHCEMMHRPIFVWDPLNKGLYILEASGLDTTLPQWEGGKA